MRQRRKNGRGKSAGYRRVLGALNGNSRPERSLPLDARLRAIGDHISPTQIAELWVFPPLPDRDATSEFLLLACYDGTDRRRIVTAQLEARLADPEDEEYDWVLRLEEHGAAPEGWVAGIPDRLLRRLSEAGVPEVVEIGGQPERWADAIQRFADGDGASAAPGHGYIDSVPAAKVVSNTLEKPSP